MSEKNNKREEMYNKIAKHMQKMHEQACSRKALQCMWYLEQEGFVTDRGDGSLRWVFLEEQQELLRTLGGNAEEIFDLIESINSDDTF